jgi:hypothetical protein
MHPNSKTLLSVGVFMGLALGSKQSAVVLVPVVFLELLLKLPARKPGALWLDSALNALLVIGTRLVAVLVVMFLVDWSLYGFRFGPKYSDAGVHSTIPDVILMVANLFPNSDAIIEKIRQTGPPLAYDTFIGQIDHATQGHDAFLMGARAHRGWWYFFPVAIALKSTPAELLMFAMALPLAAFRRTWTDPARRLWLAALLSLLGLAMCSSINIGHRYILLAYPLVVLLAVDSIGTIFDRRPSWNVLAGGLLLAWQATSVAGVAPHYLCYFNSFCGGPSQGYRYLVDSSLDWGQGLPALRRELESRGYHKVALSYFGTASADSYGLRSTPLSRDVDPVEMGCDWFAISATTLQGAYGDDGLARLFEQAPSRQAGYSIFYYDLSDPRVRAAVDAYRKR